MAKAKFTLEIGFLDRRGIRSYLQGMKHSLIYKNPDAQITIDEDKGFFESIFYFCATGITDSDACILESVIKKRFGKN